MNESLQDILKQRLSFTYREPIELLVSMSMTARKDQMLQLAEELHVEVDPFLTVLLDRTGEVLSPHMKRELGYFFDFGFFRWGPDIAFYASAFDSREDETAEQWIDRLEITPAGHIVSMMVRCAYNDNLGEFLQGRTWNDFHLDLEALAEQTRKIEPSGQVDRTQSHLLECLVHPEETKQRYMMLIRQFHRLAFAPHAQELRSKCEAAIERYEKLFQTDPKRFLHDFHKLDPTFYTRTAIHHVSFMFQIGCSLYNIGKHADWIIFGINNEQYFGPEAAIAKVEKFFKAFSDKRRLQFIRLVAQRPLYGQELAAELGVTPAAVNYHANFMVLLDMVELKRSEHRLYYNVNKEKVREMLELTAKVLLGEEKYGPGPGGGKDERD
ncbi:ArsR/SmtB family transcription factor [Paenibacillus alkalitolerans]|uniref:ArsR/SmtB family transcription factor n=1 Tax=Paenibacillus alkalitolerans TaxID=2799335 RepID=UPI0018F4EB1C|nr:winged helix-turn-helix domain-containing protein [Paenibacillus alkalitolerans]